MPKHLLSNYKILEAGTINPTDNKMFGRDCPSAWVRVAQAQLSYCEEKAKPVWQEEAVEMVFERIGEDFVEIVANFYMNEGDKRRTFELWQSLKAEILKEVSNE